MKAVLMLIAIVFGSFFLFLLGSLIVIVLYAKGESE